MVHHKFIWCFVLWLQCFCSLLFCFCWTSIFSVFHSCVIMVCMEVLMFSSFPFSDILFLVALASTNEQNHVLLSWGILVCHDNIDKTFPCEGTYLSWGSSSTSTPWCWWSQSSFSVSGTSAHTALARTTWSCSSIQSGHQVGISY